jgi:hypothetical protein
VLEKHGKGQVPSDLAEAIEATEDGDLLMYWFDAAVKANTLEEYRAAVQR